MTRILITGAAALCIALFGACSSEAAKRAAYESAYQKSCIDRTGTTANCDPGHKSYDEYRKQREQPEQERPLGR